MIVNFNCSDIEEKISAIAAAEVLTSEKMNKKEQVRLCRYIGTLEIIIVVYIRLVNWSVL